MTSGGRLEVAWLAPYARIRLLASTVVLAALTAGASLAQAFDPERTFTPGAFAFSLGGGGESRSASALAAGRPSISGGSTVARRGCPLAPSAGTGRYTERSKSGSSPSISSTSVERPGTGRARPGRGLSFPLARPFRPLRRGGRGGGRHELACSRDRLELRFPSLWRCRRLTLRHVSNGNTSQPNRGFEANTSVLGVSFYFP
jgi:hypothetical protein